MARRFLYAIALLVVLVIAGLMGLRFWARELSELAFVPTGSFVAPARLSEDAYARASTWISRGQGSPRDPARWLPDGAPRDPAPLAAAVFFIHPTSHFDRTRWNARPNDPFANQRADLFTRGLASPFNAAAELWAPRYRQATFGAFLTDKPEGRQALDVAYGDINAAFSTFLAHADPKLPIVLVGHSQGALHLMRLLRDRVAGQKLARRIVAAYVIGWPVSLSHDLPAMGLPACVRASQTGCILSWQSYAEPADPAMSLAAYARFPGLDGRSRAKDPFLCTNPLTGKPGGSAPASANLGTLVPDRNLSGAKLVPGMVPARCSPQGFLLIGPPPDLGPYVLPGNNYHIYDIPLFWANVRADVRSRVTRWWQAR